MKKAPVDKTVTYEFGIMSNKHSIKSKDKLTAYAAMVVQYMNNPNMIAIYSPEEAKKESWMNIDGTTDKKLDAIFGGEGSFEKYLYENIDEIKACLKTVKKLV